MEPNRGTIQRMRDCARHPAAPLLLAALLSAAAVAAHALDCTASPQLCAELSLTSYTAEGGAPAFCFPNLIER